MAHNIERNNNRNSDSFFSRKEVAWHGLGQVIQEAVTAEEALHLANLDYEVQLRPIFTSYIPEGYTTRAVFHDGKSQYELIDKHGIYTETFIPKKGELITTNKAVCRMDNMTTLGIVGNKYMPVQNKESLDFIYNIFKNNPDITDKNDIIIETAGVLGIGERIFVTAKLPAGFKIGNEKDTTDLYIVFTNSHDGTSSLTAMVTSIRVVCNNTLTAALGSAKSKFRFRHTANIRTSMADGLSLLNLSYEVMQSNQEAYNALLNIKVDMTTLDNLICKAMLNDNQLMHLSRVGWTNIDKDIISSRVKNQILDIKDYVDMGCGQEYNRGTAYWAYMGMNSYLNNGSNFKDDTAKFDNLLSGTSSTVDSKMLQTCLSLL